MCCTRKGICYQRFTPAPEHIKFDPSLALNGAAIIERRKWSTVYRQGTFCSKRYGSPEAQLN